MPQLVWNPIDLLSMLGVLPTVEEDAVSHHNTLVRHPLRLELTLWQYDSDVALQLFVVALPEPVLHYTLQGCPGIRLIDDKRHFLRVCRRQYVHRSLRWVFCDALWPAALD